jgi:hypothetical protein
MGADMNRFENGEAWPARQAIFETKTDLTARSKPLSLQRMLDSRATNATNVALARPRKVLGRALGELNNDFRPVMQPEFAVPKVD